MVRSQVGPHRLQFPGEGTLVHPPTAAACSPTHVRSSPFELSYVSTAMGVGGGAGAENDK